MPKNDKPTEEWEAPYVAPEDRPLPPLPPIAERLATLKAEFHAKRANQLPKVSAMDHWGVVAAVDALIDLVTELAMPKVEEPE